VSESYGVYPVVDLIRRTSVEAHCGVLERVVQFGAGPVTGGSLEGELQHDWAPQDTVENVIRILITERLLKE
jgi:hypothetical protein